MPLANLFRRPHYTSEATTFLNQLKRAKPWLDEDQREGRALLWEKPVDSELQAQFSAARVPQPPYVYQTE